MKMPMWLLRLWSKAAPRRSVIYIDGDEVLDDVRIRDVVVAREGGLDWEAAMKCPCGCGDTLRLELVPEARPRWQLSASAKGHPSLHPSVHRIGGCKAHFWLKDGKIYWCV